MAKRQIYIRAICHGCDLATSPCQKPLRMPGDWRFGIELQQLNHCRDYVPDGDCTTCFHRLPHGVVRRSDAHAHTCVLHPGVSSVSPGSCQDYVHRDITDLDSWIKRGYIDTEKYVDQEFS